MNSRSFAQTKNINITHLTTRDGLSNNHVTAVLEDRKGFIWLATSDGLNKWDGYGFEVFKKDSNDPESLPGNYILCLAEDDSQNIWIGTNNHGLARYNTAEQRIYRYEALPDNNTIPGNIIRCITVDKQNNVWIGTNYGLALYSEGTDNFTRMSFPSETTDRLEYTLDIRDIVQIDRQKLVIQSNQGLFNFDLATEKMTKAENPLPAIDRLLFRQKEPICYDRKNQLWIGSTRGLIRYNLLTKSHQIYQNDKNDKNSISSNNFSAIFEDSQGHIWIGTSNRGLNRYNEETDDFTVVKNEFYPESQLSTDIVTYIYEDSHASLWFASMEGGAGYFNDRNKKIEYFKHTPNDPNSISSNKVGAIHQDENGDIWIGTKDGELNKLLNERRTIERYRLKTASIAPSILDIEQAGPNLFYVTGWQTGLYAFNTQNGRFTDLMKGARINGKQILIDIKGMKLDSKGKLWLATHSADGIVVYDPAFDKFYNRDSPGPYPTELLSVEYAVSFEEDSQNRLWVISYAGVYLFDGAFHAFNHDPADPQTLSTDYAYTLYEDKAKNIWVGHANGLDRLYERGGKWIAERYSNQYELPNNIKGILEDDNGCLWLSSNREITRFHPATRAAKHFYIDNEIPNHEFYERSCLRSANGELYFGGTNGLIKFHPDSLDDHEEGHRVHLVDFQIFNESQKVGGENSPLTRSISDTKAVVLNYNQSVLTFEYVAVHYNKLRPLEYAYRMEGFDEHWYFVGDKRFATYTNLPPGDYTFHVKVAEGAQLREGSGTSLKITIRPPIWRTNLAYVIYLLIILLIFYAYRKSVLYREKLRNQLALDQIEIQNVRNNNLMKLRFFTNISHEFRTPLTLIKAPIEKLMESGDQLDAEEQKYHYQLIKNNTGKLLQMVNQLMDYRKLEAGNLVLEPSRGDIVSFCRDMWSVFSPLAAKKDITYDFHSSVPSLSMEFDPDKLDKIISNILSNAFKYTLEHGHIVLAIEKKESANKPEQAQEPFLSIRIVDDGVGIPEKDLPFIFDRFYSQERKGARKKEGTGIGLTLAQELTKLHGGEISARSEEGKGSEFEILLPIGKCHAPDKEEERKPADRSWEKEYTDEAMGRKADERKKADNDRDTSVPKYRLLVVEDDEEMGLFLQKELSADYKVSLAKDGEEGLRKAFFDIPHLIISDVTMPNMDGITFCRSIKSDERTSHIPVVLLTARHAQGKQLEGLESGADDYIFKPFNLAILKSRVNNLLQSRRELMEKFKKGTGLEFDHEGIERKDRDLIQSIIEIVLKHIQEEKLNADFLAERINMSRSMVYLKIESLTGQSVNEFIRNIRLKRSTQLLLESDRTVTEIAYAVGFNSQSYFTRSFIKQFGVSPKEFIKKHTGKSEHN
ncbi:MAG: response regulator [Lewinellaceae bacterium]|nr:response regulator [Lewinellaceae bacterium]